MTHSLRVALAATAATAAILAALAGAPRPANGSAADMERLAAAVAREDDHVTALELAQWIREGRRGLRIVDLRNAEAFDEYHLPRAERIVVESLPRTRFRDGETIVLVSDAGGHAAQGWVFLEVLGHRNVFFLRGGLAEWEEDVMHPTLAVDAPPPDVAAFRRVSELSRYFGGVPRVAGSHTTAFGAPPGTGVTEARETWRRGC